MCGACHVTAAWVQHKPWAHCSAVALPFAKVHHLCYTSQTLCPHCKPMLASQSQLLPVCQHTLQHPQCTRLQVTSASDTLCWDCDNGCAAPATSTVHIRTHFLCRPGNSLTWAPQASSSRGPSCFVNQQPAATKPDPAHSRGPCVRQCMFQSCTRTMQPPPLDSNYLAAAALCSCRAQLVQSSTLLPAQKKRAHWGA